AFAQHYRRGGVAGVAPGFDLGEVPRAGGGTRVDLDAEETRAAGFFARALAGCWQQSAEPRPGWPESQPRHPGLQPGTGRGAQHGRGRAATEPGDLAVAEPAAIGPALQGVAAAHHPGVETGHDERAHPHPQVAVVADPLQVTLVAEVGFGRAVRAERIRV